MSIQSLTYLHVVPNHRSTASQHDNVQNNCGFRAQKSVPTEIIGTWTSYVQQHYPAKYAASRKSYESEKHVCA